MQCRHNKSSLTFPVPKIEDIDTPVTERKTRQTVEPTIAQKAFMDDDTKSRSNASTMVVYDSMLFLRIIKDANRYCFTMRTEILENNQLCVLHNFKNAWRVRS